MTDSHHSISFSETIHLSPLSHDPLLYYVKLVLSEEIQEHWDTYDKIENLKREHRLHICYIEDKLEEKYYKEK